LTEHLRLSGIYWGLTALHILGQPGALPRNELIQNVLDCWHVNGGFGAAPGHDAHLLYTVNAVQTLTLLSAWKEVDERRQNGTLFIAQCMSS